MAEEELLADAYAGMNRFRDADATKYTQTVRQSVQERTNRQTAKATEKKTGPPQRFSISETEDGRAVAVVDSDILNSIDTTNWNEAKKDQAKAAAKTALLAFKDGVQVNGIDYKVNKKSRDEYTRSNDTERTYRKNKSAFADKMRASANVGDIITATTDWAKDGRLKHPRTDNIKDFLHGEILIQSGENRYEAKTVIGITDQNQYVFYDVVDMTPIDFEMKEEPSSAASGKNAVSAILEGPSKNNIADEEEEVKQSFSESEDDLSAKYPRLNLNEDISELDGVPAIELRDGSVLPLDENPGTGHRYTHVEFINRNRIDIDDLKSGGWIGNGVYEPSYRSDTERYIERQQAKTVIPRPVRDAACG